MSDPRPTDDELLAAYADGGLDPRDTARLDAHTDGDPDAAAEVDGLRRTINAVRATQPRPTAEPAWDQMARSIRAACDPLPAPRPRARWLVRLLRPRVAAPILAIAAAATIALIWTGRHSAAPQPQRLVAASEPTAGDSLPPDTAPDTLAGDPATPPEALPAVAALDDGQLDAVLAVLDAEAPNLSGDATGADSSSDDTTAVGLFGDDAYASWVDDLDESQIDAASDYLATQPG